jgi:exosortase
MSSTRSKPALNPQPAGRRSKERQNQPRPEPAKALSTAIAPRSSTADTAKLALAAACLVAGLIAYLPTLIGLVRVWYNEPDYSHGFLVIPLAIVFLVLRRDTFPGLAGSSPLLAIGLLAVSIGLRVIGAKYFFTFMDGWSIVPWAAAVVAVVGGWPLLRWCLPSIGFLIFMVPLPFRFEGELSAPLQRIATKLSTTALQLLGQPAFNDGNVIQMGEERLEVAQACSGLRLFMSVLALTYAYIMIIQRPWWEKLLLALAAVPIAIISNSARIVATGLLYQITQSESIRQWAHDSAGWGMILFAAVLYWLLLWYLRRLIHEEEDVDMATLVRQAQI